MRILVRCAVFLTDGGRVAFVVPTEHTHYPWRKMPNENFLNASVQVAAS
jgi:hypothetical protein